MSLKSGDRLGFQMSSWENMSIVVLMPRGNQAQTISESNLKGLSYSGLLLQRFLRTHLV